MRTWKILCSALAVAGVMAPPAAAQERTRRVADEVARQIREAAEGIRTVRDAVDDTVSDVRFSGRDRYAIDRCRPSLERYGRLHVDDVRPYGRRSLRVYGTIDSGGYAGRYDDRYDRSRYERSRYDRYGLRSFTCTVRDDGRVKLKTQRLRR